jgi:hypothetical protein
MKLEPMVCQNCAGKINDVTMVCEYCGTKYRRSPNDGCLPYIVVDRTHAQVIGTTVKVPIETIQMIGEEKAAEYIKDSLVDEIKRQLADYMSVATSLDLKTNSYDVHARVRLLPPNYKF